MINLQVKGQGWGAEEQEQTKNELGESHGYPSLNSWNEGGRRQDGLFRASSY